MMSRIFVGGLVTGAAGLLAAALYDSHRTEAQYSPLLKTPELMDAEETSRQLNNYFFKAQSIYAKCNKIVIETSDYIVTPLPLPNDGIFQRTANKLGGKLTGMGRNWRNKELLGLKKDCKDLYARYQGVFLRANELLRERGRTPVKLDVITFKGNDFSINNALENEDWDTDFDRLADNVRGYIEKSCGIAEQLIELLGQKEAAAAIGSNAENK